jgi:hypothetical protein
VTVPDRRLAQASSSAGAADLRGLRRFLADRLTEDLARVWDRSQTRGDPRRHPGTAAQVAVIDDLLTTLRAGRLPPRWELRIMLFGYAAHPDYEPGWTELLSG